MIKNIEVKMNKFNNNLSISYISKGLENFLVVKNKDELEKSKTLFNNAEDFVFLKKTLVEKNPEFFI